MKLAILESLKIRRVDLVPNLPIVASLVYPCIGLPPAFYALHQEGKSLC